MTADHDPQDLGRMAARDQDEMIAIWTGNGVIIVLIITMNVEVPEGGKADLESKTERRRIDTKTAAPDIATESTLTTAETAMIIDVGEMIPAHLGTEGAARQKGGGTATDRARRLQLAEMKGGMRADIMKEVAMADATENDEVGATAERKKYTPTSRRGKTTTPAYKETRHFGTVSSG